MGLARRGFFWLFPPPFRVSAPKHDEFWGLPPEQAVKPGSPVMTVYLNQPDLSNLTPTKGDEVEDRAEYTTNEVSLEAKLDAAYERWHEANDQMEKYQNVREEALTDTIEIGQQLAEKLKAIEATTKGKKS